MSDTSPLKISGVLFSLACAACVGMHVVISKLALTDVSAILAIAVMSLCSLVFSFIPYLSSGDIPRVAASVPRQSIYLVLIHSLLASGGMAFTWTGLQYLNPTITSFVGRVEVLFSVMTAVWFLGETVNFRKAVGFALGVGGVLVLGYPGSDKITLFFRDGNQLGMLCVICGALCYGTCEVFSVKSIRMMSAKDFLLLRSFFNSCFLVTLALCTQKTFGIALDSFTLLFFAAFLGPYFGRHMFMSSVKRIPLSISVGINQTQPLFAAAFGLLFVMDLPTKQQWYGGALILFGCFFLVKARGEQRDGSLLQKVAKFATARRAR